MTDVVIEGVTKRFGAVVALDDVTLAVPDGTLTAILGPSGCGKTTLLRVVAGFERPDSGRVRLGDRQVAGSGSAEVPPERRRVGLVPQESALFPHLDVAGNVGFGLPRKQRQTRVRDLLELVGLPGFERRRPHELSGGEQARVALARALAPKPEVVLLDEPFAALDAALRAEIRDDVRQVLQATAATGVLVTHDQEEALSMADHVAVMRRGRVIQMATPVDVYGSPVDLEVAQFVGDGVSFAVVARDGVASTPLGELRLRNGASGPGVVLVRPEQLRLAAAGATGEVSNVVFYGHDAVVQVVMPEGDMVSVRVTAPVEVQAGDVVRLSVTGAAHFYPKA
ncbi:MAG TPA: ABC transporter ATP-binding protein [Actinomycetes bacterium]|nr:ABC transporter ATP-binding protein [Actinomycetes bacterium]